MATKQRKGADTVGLPPERHERAELLRPFVGQVVTLVWAIGSQQVKNVISGKLTEVTARCAELMNTKPASANNVFTLPLSFLIRFESEEFSADAAPVTATVAAPLEYDPSARPAAVLTDSARMYLAEQESGRNNEEAVADLKAAANVPYPGNRLDNLPPGQKCTWHQWCGNAGHPTSERSGEAWAAYLSGMTGGQYRNRWQRLANGLPQIGVLFAQRLKEAGYSESVETDGALDAKKARRAANLLLGRAASDRPDPKPEEWIAATEIVCAARESGKAGLLCQLREGAALP